MLAYDELDRLAAEMPCVCVDFAGNGVLRRAIHMRFTQLKHSAAIGGTHVDQLAVSGSGKDLPGPRATLFFAPSQVKKRTVEWGAEGFGQRMVQAWRTFTTQVTDAQAPWLRTEHHHGGAAVQAAYAEVLAGCGDPRIGHILPFSAS